jgi:hypothetical protein
MFVDPVIGAGGISLGVLIISGGNPTAKKLATGIYEINHFSFDTLISKRGGNLRDEDDWVDMFWGDDAEKEPFDDYFSYGVCDGLEQFLRTELGKKIVESPRKFCMSLTRVTKAGQGDGGWRWHKWGPYIGEHEPTTEYLADEPKIDEVWVFHIFVRKLHG